MQDIKLDSSVNGTWVINLDLRDKALTGAQLIKEVLYNILTRLLFAIGNESKRKASGKIFSLKKP